MKRRATLKEKPDKNLKLQPQKTAKTTSKKKEGDSDGGRKSDTEDKEDSVKAKKEEPVPEPVDDTVTTKKKLKKNVESKDACTQTERSDYMLIKQRQKQKEIIQMAK